LAGVDTMANRMLGYEKYNQMKPIWIVSHDLGSYTWEGISQAQSSLWRRRDLFMSFFIYSTLRYEMRTYETYTDSTN